jgi:lipopolysaccharide transport system permease protein
MESIPFLLNPINLLLRLWRQRTLIVELTKRDVGQRFRSSVLGVLWTLIVPLFMLAIYTFVFSYIFQARWQTADRPPSTGEFALALFAGLTPFTVFSETLNRSTTIIVGSPNYVKKVVFPLDVLVVVVLGSALINSLINVGIIVFFSVVLLNTISPTLLLLPLVYLPLILLSLGLGWFLSSLGVYIRDVAQGIAIIMQVLSFLSPVFYPIDMVPQIARPIFMLNPLTTIITGFRSTLLWGQTLPWGHWAAWTVASAIIAVLGYAWFMKTRKGFPDVL